MSGSTSTLTLETIEEWLDNHYNAALSTYVYDDHVRLTNGSAAHYVNIAIADGQMLTLKGERYGKTIDKSCDAAKDALLETLSKTI